MLTAVILAWPSKPRTVATPQPTRPTPVEPKTAAVIPWARVPTPEGTELRRIAADHLRYTRYLEKLGVAFLDDPVSRQTWTVKKGDPLLGFVVESVDDKLVRLTSSALGPRVIAFTGPPPPPPIQRPYADRPEDLPMAFAPGVKPDLEKERELQRRAEQVRTYDGSAHRRQMERKQKRAAKAEPAN